MTIKGANNESYSVTPQGQGILNTVLGAMGATGLNIPTLLGGMGGWGNPARAGAVEAITSDDKPISRYEAGMMDNLAKKDAKGNLVGIWGAMSDLSHTFKPWEDGFRKGLYLAGVECVDGAEPPAGWTKWTIPSYEYIVVENHPGVFEETIGHMKEKGSSLVGAVHDYTDPVTGTGYMYFPIRKIQSVQNIGPSYFPPCAW